MAYDLGDLPPMTFLLRSGMGDAGYPQRQQSKTGSCGRRACSWFGRGGLGLSSWPGRRGVGAGRWITVHVVDRSPSQRRFFASGDLRHHIYVAPDGDAVLVRLGTGYGQVARISLLRELASRIS